MYSLPKGGVGAELGVAKGVFSERLLELTSPRLLYLVDCWVHQPKPGDTTSDVQHLQRMRVCLSRMRFHIGIGIVRVLCGMSGHVVSMIPEQSLDWVFIDADQSYRSCMLDLSLWSPRVKPGGIIAVHDYTTPIKALRGVKRAVDDFLKVRCAQLQGITQERKGTAWFERTW